MKINIQSSLNILLVCGVFLFCLYKGMHRSDLYGYHSNMSKYVSAAITSMDYKKGNFIAYREIHNHLVNSDLSNSDIKSALEINIPDNAEIITMGSINIGYVDFTRIAFFIFGYGIDSLLYLYFLILCISLILISYQCKDRPCEKLLITLFLAAHLLAITSILIIDHNVRTIYNPRLIPILGIIPLAHICFTVNNLRYSFLSLFSIIFQSSILVLVYHTRSSAVWMLIIVIIFWAWRFIIHLKKDDYLRKESDSIIRSKLIYLLRVSLPYIILFSILFIFKFNLSYRIDKEYILKGEGDYAHYQVIYSGLALHPDIRKKYTRERGHYDSTILINRCKIDKYQDDFILENYFKMAMRKLYCSHPNVLSIYYHFKHQWFYKANDQDGFSAAFNWIIDHGNDIYKITNIDKSESVDTSVFTFFKHEKMNVNSEGRKFDFLRDFHWYRFQKILKSVIWDVITTQPLQSFNVVFVRKPLLFIHLYLSYFFFTAPFVLSIFLLILLRRYILKFSPRVEILKKYRIIVICFFLASILPFLIAYPGNYAMFPQAILLHVLLYLTILINVNTKNLPYMTILIPIGLVINLVMLKL